MHRLGLIVRVFAFIGLVGLIYWKFMYTPPIPKESVVCFDQQGQQVVIDPNKPSIISFYQTWCSDCVRETPVLHEFAELYKIPIYFISDEPAEKVAKFRARFADTTIPFYSSKQTLASIGIKKFPTVNFYNARGELVIQKLEVVDSTDLNLFLVKIGVVPHLD